MLDRFNSALVDAAVTPPVPGCVECRPGRACPGHTPGTLPPPELCGDCFEFCPIPGYHCPEDGCGCSCRIAYAALVADGPTEDISGGAS